MIEWMSWLIQFPDREIRKETKMEVVHRNQKQLAAREYGQGY